MDEPLDPVLFTPDKMIEEPPGDFDEELADKIWDGIGNGSIELIPVEEIYGLTDNDKYKNS